MNKKQLVKTIAFEPAKLHVDLAPRVMAPSAGYPESAPIAYYAPKEHDNTSPSIMDKIRALFSLSTPTHMDEASLVKSEG